MTGSRDVERRHGLVPDFDTWFGREFPGLPGWRPATAAHSIPVEMTKDDGAYLLRAELPGMDLEDITITVEGDRITVAAEHSESTEDKEHSEFRYGSFRRSVRVPATIPSEGVEASYAKGVLTIRIPVPAEEARTVRTIPVKRADGESEGGTP